ncbi:hypothetical protein CJ030_MR4G006403 [Morella rubra]|uniref:Uncharacterized protein n=1 Tax=Morella rubra TaxID=262757 RepID=A0A6A1VW71_9ROSI|nr:hypothetical protein CJ030_MR4G006403 [Morella rubra]
MEKGVLKIVIHHGGQFLGGRGQLYVGGKWRRWAGWTPITSHYYRYCVTCVAIGVLVVALLFIIAQEIEHASYFEERVENEESQRHRLENNYVEFLMHQIVSLMLRKWTLDSIYRCI